MLMTHSLILSVIKLWFGSGNAHQYLDVAVCWMKLNANKRKVLHMAHGSGTISLIQCCSPFEAADSSLPLSSSKYFQDAHYHPHPHPNSDPKQADIA